MHKLKLQLIFEMYFLFVNVFLMSKKYILYSELLQ